MPEQKEVEALIKEQTAEEIGESLEQYAEVQYGN